MTSHQKPDPQQLSGTQLILILVFVPTVWAFLLVVTKFIWGVTGGDQFLLDNSESIIAVIAILAAPVTAGFTALFAIQTVEARRQSKKKKGDDDEDSD